MAPLLRLGHSPILRQDGTALAFHRRHWTRSASAGSCVPSLLTAGRPGVRGQGRWAGGFLGQGWLEGPAARRCWAALGWAGDWRPPESYGACVEWTDSLALLLMAPGDLPSVGLAESEGREAEGIPSPGRSAAKRPGGAGSPAAHHPSCGPLPAKAGPTPGSPSAHPSVAPRNPPFQRSPSRSLRLIAGPHPDR